MQARQMSSPEEGRVCNDLRKRDKSAGWVGQAWESNRQSSEQGSDLSDLCRCMEVLLHDRHIGFWSMEARIFCAVTRMQ